MATCIHGTHWDGVASFYCDRCAVNATGSLSASPFVFTAVSGTQTEEERVLAAMDRTGQDVGLYRKFQVKRADGSSELGGKHQSCAYFVLDWQHDPFAVPAARAYADACESKYPALAADLREAASFAERRWTEKAK